MSGRSSRSRERSDSSRGHRSRSRREHVRSHRTSRKRRRENSCAGRDSSRNEALDTILVRLNAIEGRLSTSGSEPPHPVHECHTSSLPHATDTVAAPAESVCNATNKIVTALTSLITKPSHYYISNFDPKLHDFDVWCAEVDKGREINRWDDRECLSRIGRCLKGDARMWLDDWVSNDRSWTNFKVDFRSLCPRNIDIANILFDVMKTDSNNFSTYAEYARKTLLRLNIVKGLSDDLKTAIVIRGITDPQIKATASNAKLHYNELVEFLSVYTKPKIDSRNTRNFVRQSNSHNVSKNRASKPDMKCFNCGDVGHTKFHCTKRVKKDSLRNTVDPVVPKTTPTCTYCSRTGHTVDKCFTKQRVESKGQNSTNVNFCQTTSDVVIQ